MNLLTSDVVEVERVPDNNYYVNHPPINKALVDGSVWKRAGDTSGNHVYLSLQSLAYIQFLW